MRKIILSKKREKFIMLRNKIFKVRRAALVATLVALVALVVAILVACPAVNPGPGASPRYLCENGTPVEGTTDTAGQTRCASCNLLYRLDGTTDAVGRSCGQVAIGEATRIGLVTEFGVGEGTPSGLAAIDSTLYMVGLDADFLYTLNIDPDDSTPDGRAMQVGGLSAGFGVDERGPTGLAAIGTTLYMVGVVNDVLYTLNIDSTDSTDDGRAIQVGNTPAGFGLGEISPTGLAAINSTLYMVGQTANALYTLNIDPDDGTADDGRAMQVGSATNFGVGEDQVNSLGAIGTTLYMAGERNEVLYTLNTTNGMATQVGLANQFGANEGSPTGLTAIGDTLYMVGSTRDALHALRYQ